MAVILQLVFVCVICCLNFDVHSEEIDHRFFLDQILDKYGFNGSISYEGFQQLYQNLGLGISSDVSVKNGSVKSSESLSRGSRHVIEHNDCKEEEELAQVMDLHDELKVLPSLQVLPPPYCLSASQVLDVYGVSNSSISPVAFLHLCPALIYELDQQTCSKPHGSHLHTGSASMTNWLYAVVIVGVISMTGLLCVALVPLLQKSFVSQLISFLVALAVGTLLGDAFLHLIPHALENNERSHSHTNSIMSTSLMFLSTAVFFTFEAVIKLIKTRKEEEKSKDALYIPVSGDKEMMEMIKTPPIHGHQHSHSSNNTVLMILVGDGLHNFIDGLAIGGAFAGGTATGFATSVAVLTHELPHELGDFAVLLQSGMSVRSALMCNILLSLLSLLGTILGLVIGNFGTSWIYAITAATFIYIALTNLVPEINRELHNWSGVLLSLSGFLLGGAIMGCIAVFEHHLQNLFKER